VDLLASPEQLEIAASAAAFLAARWPTTRTRALIHEPVNIDGVAWAEAAGLGWFSLGLPESAGGVGCGLADEASLFREIGRSLACGPFLATVLGARVAAFGGRPDLAARIIAGSAVVGLVVPDPGAEVDGSEVSGRLELLDATDAELVLVAGPARASLLAMADLGATTPVGCLDPTTRLVRVEVAGVAPVVSVSSQVDPVERRGQVLLAALDTGLAEATRDVAAGHAKNRVQFDRPIGVNQAVKHPCADMAVQAELAWAQTLVAALSVDEDREDAELQALTARVVAGHAAEGNAAATVQVLGGMGFTFEHDANLFVKRAYVLGHAFGGERDVLSRLIELPAAV